MTSTIKSVCITSPFILFSLLLLLELPIQCIYANRLSLANKLPNSDLFNSDDRLKAQHRRRNHKLRDRRQLPLIESKLQNVPEFWMPIIAEDNKFSRDNFISSPRMLAPLIADPIFNPRFPESPGSYIAFAPDNNRPILSDNQFPSFYQLFTKRELIKILKLCKLSNGKNRLRYEHLTLDSNGKSGYTSLSLQCNYVNIISHLVSVDINNGQGKSDQQPIPNALRLEGPISDSAEEANSLTYTTYTAFFLLFVLLVFTFILALYNYCLLAYL